MDPNALIEAYVQQVVRRLPGRLRTDVGAELRDSLSQELEAKAQEAGRPADEAMTFELLDAFGRPQHYAIRYYQPWAIIDPADTPMFILAAVVCGLVGKVAETLLPAGDDLGPAGWLGLLVLIFGFKSWVHRRLPDRRLWRPRRLVDHDSVSRAWHLIAIVAILIGMVFYASPSFFIDHLTGGAAATYRLHYTGHFTSLANFRQPGLLGLWGGYALILAVAAVQGRWRPLTRWLEIAFLISIALQFGWHARVGMIFDTPAVDLLTRRLFALFGAILLIDAAIKIYRQWGRIHLPKSSKAAGA